MQRRHTLTDLTHIPVTSGPNQRLGNRKSVTLVGDNCVIPSKEEKEVVVDLDYIIKEKPKIKVVRDYLKCQLDKIELDEENSFIVEINEKVKEKRGRKPTNQTNNISQNNNISTARKPIIS